MFWCLMYSKAIKACLWPKMSYVLQAGLWSKPEYSALREKLAKPVPSPTMVVNDSGGYVTIDSATRSAVESSQSTADRCVKRFIGKVHGMTESIFPWFNILADRVSSTSPRVRAGHRCRRTWTASSTPGCSWRFPTGAWPSTPSFRGCFCNTRAFLMGFGILRRNCVWNFLKKPWMGRHYRDHRHGGGREASAWGNPQRLERRGVWWSPHGVVLSWQGVFIFGR